MWNNHIRMTTYNRCTTIQRKHAPSFTLAAQRKAWYWTSRWYSTKSDTQQIAKSDIQQIAQLFVVLMGFFCLYSTDSDIQKIAQLFDDLMGFVQSSNLRCVGSVNDGARVCWMIVCYHSNLITWLYSASLILDKWAPHRVKKTNEYISVSPCPPPPPAIPLSGYVEYSG